MATSTRLRAALALVLACTLAAAVAPWAQAATGSMEMAAASAAPAFDLERDVYRALQLFQVPGVAIAIVQDGKVVAARGFGLRTLGRPAPVDAHTLFAIASNSKAFTVTALAQLVDQGRLAWDDPVTQHLPDFQMYDSYVTGQMTVRDLLTHRSGLGLGAGDLLWWPTTQLSTAEIIHQLRYVKPATSFRASYAYDNLLYIVAGDIVARKAGKPWGEAIRAQILAPLGMNDTTTSLAENAGKTDLASPHSTIHDKVTVVQDMPVPNAVGAVGINTSATDIARWMEVLLAGGKMDSVPGAATDARLFSAARGNDMWSAQTPIAIPPATLPALASLTPNFSAYGLGFQLRDYHGMKLALHGGALVGFYSRVALVPQAHLGVAILTNAENSGLIEALQWRILDHYLKLAPSDWIGTIGQLAQQQHQAALEQVGKAAGARAASSSPSLPLAAYDGAYQDPWYGKVVIRHEGGKQVLSFTRTPVLTGELVHFQHDSFIVHWKERNLNADAYVTFALNPDGSIDHVKMAPVSAETDFSYDFADLVLTPVKPAAVAH